MTREAERSVSDLTSIDDRRAVERPWSMSIGDVAAALDVDPNVGLEEPGTRHRRERWGANQIPVAPPPGWPTRFLRQFRDPLVMLLLGAIAVSVVVWLVDSNEAVPIDAIVISLVVIANASIGMWQEGRAIDAVAALHRLTRPISSVLRGGRVVDVVTTDVVVGDVLVVEEGDAVTADARIVSAVGIEVDESTLTGESRPIAKSPAPVGADVPMADRTSMVHSGTSVTKGRARALVVAVGRQTEVGRVASLVGRLRQEETPLQRQIALLSRQLAVAVVAIAGILVAAVLLLRDVDSGADLLDLMFAAIALAVAAVPEGLPAIMAVVLALGVQRMARQRVIVRRLVSVETLGSTTVICTDKTGTLTQNEMTVVRAATTGLEVSLTGVGYRPIGEITAPPDASPGSLADIRALLAAGAASCNAEVTLRDGDWEARGDPTEIALVVADRKTLTGHAGDTPFGRRVDELPFDGDRKLMSVLLEPSGPSTGAVAMIQITKGAPEQVLDRCSHTRVEGADVALTQSSRTHVDETVTRWAAGGLRTLAVAVRRHRSRPTPFATSAESDLTLVGVVAIIDPLRPAARESVRAARSAGVSVRMVTGDHPATALSIARELDMDVRMVSTGADVDRAVGDERADRLAESSVLARVTPQHKLAVVSELRRRGEIVAMTGDGVNDAPALRHADIGVAMGRSGTDVARDASDMILTDDDFGAIVEAVREGRQIYANIRKFLRYLLATNAGEVLLMIAGVIAAVPLGLADADGGVALPLLATQILWINLVTDAAPALALGVDPAVDDVMAQPPRRRDEPVIDAAMWSTIALIGVITAVVGLVALDLGLAGGLLGGSGDLAHGRTMAFTTVVIAQVVNAFNSRSETTTAVVGLVSNRLLLASVTAAVVAQVLVVHVGMFNEAFSTVPLSGREWLLCAGLSSLVLVASETQKWMRRHRSAMRRS